MRQRGFLEPIFDQLDHTELAVPVTREERREERQRLLRLVGHGEALQDELCLDRGGDETGLLDGNRGRDAKVQMRRGRLEVAVKRSHMLVERARARLGAGVPHFYI